MGRRRLEVVEARGQANVALKAPLVPLARGLSWALLRCPAGNCSGGFGFGGDLDLYLYIVPVGTRLAGGGGGAA
jgi:hypothetical protein